MFCFVFFCLSQIANIECNVKIVCHTIVCDTTIGSAQQDLTFQVLDFIDDKWTYESNSYHLEQKGTQWVISDKNKGENDDITLNEKKISHCDSCAPCECANFVYASPTNSKATHTLGMHRLLFIFLFLCVCVCVRLTQIV